jgi:hypothetical protein
LVKPGGREKIRDLVITASEEEFEMNIRIGKMSTRVVFDLKEAKRLNRSLDEWLLIASQWEAYRSKPNKQVAVPSRIEA